MKERLMQTDGKVAFHNDAHAARFAGELHQRYGSGIMAGLAAGRSDALSADFRDADLRAWIVRAPNHPDFRTDPGTLRAGLLEA
jgi:hypothetical protein